LRPSALEPGRPRPRRGRIAHGRRCGPAGADSPGRDQGIPAAEPASDRRRLRLAAQPRAPALEPRDHRRLPGHGRGPIRPSGPVGGRREVRLRQPGGSAADAHPVPSRHPAHRQGFRALGALGEAGGIHLSAEDLPRQVLSREYAVGYRRCSNEFVSATMFQEECVSTSIPTDPSPKFAEYADGTRLVSTEWVAEHAGDPGLVIVESDEDVLLYETGHITGAGKADWHTERNDSVTRDYVDGEGFAALMSAKGISRDDTIVVYGDKSTWWAAYALWVFTLFGHEDVRLMDGGRAKWQAEGREMTTEK